MSNGTPQRIIRCVVRGRAQGVGYRAWSERQAVARGLAGWVRNKRDGSVEAVFAGDPDNVAAMAESLMRGQPAAQVSGIEIVDADANALDMTFGVRFSFMGLCLECAPGQTKMRHDYKRF